MKKSRYDKARKHARNSKSLNDCTYTSKAFRREWLAEFERTHQKPKTHVVVNAATLSEAVELIKPLVNSRGIASSGFRSGGKWQIQIREI
ncbi:hypothetical protein OAF54_01725 [bacterium]|nr:hypothetical protein [bacterium]